MSAPTPIWCVAGAERTELAARFSLANNPAARDWLTAQELLDDDECLLRRVITSEGRSAPNQRSPVPLAQLKSLGQLLINIHGQHAHQLLLKPDHGLTILDGYAGHHTLLDGTRQRCQAVAAVPNERVRLQQDKSQREARRQLLQYQVEELDALALQPGDMRRSSRSTRLANGGQIVSDCQAPHLSMTTMR